ncbi:MAG: glycosyltransferase family 4 protein, partial [Verrucomicrobiales bacterium]
MGATTPRIAYLFSRYPVVSQTFCDSEMLALEKAGTRIVIGSINPPKTAFRHERLANLEAEVLYPPPSAALKARFELAGRRGGEGWEALAALQEDHEERYGPEFKAATRARNGLYFAELFARLGVGHVHVHFANRATHTALFIARYAGIPFSFTAHARDFMVDLGSDELLGELCAEASFVVAVSDFTRDMLRESYPESAEKIVRIYNGIVLEDFPARRGPRVPGEPLRVISVGRMVQFKGFEHVIEACALLMHEGLPVQCTIVGDGPRRALLHALAERLGLGEQIRFTGVMSQEEIKRELAASDAFVLPCVMDDDGASDILPTVIMEAMAVGLPVISTGLAGVKEMMEHEKTGLLVAPEDDADLAGAIRRLAENEELCGRFGAAGREKAGELFRLEDTSGQLAARFQSALAAAGREHHQPSTPSTPP